jgi:hypothetical protein
MNGRCDSKKKKFISWAMLNIMCVKMNTRDIII